MMGEWYLSCGSEVGYGKILMNGFGMGGVFEELM